MHVDDPALSWVSEIEKSFQPYSHFVEQVTLKLEHLALIETSDLDSTLETVIAERDESLRVLATEREGLQASLSLAHASLSQAQSELAQTHLRELAALDARSALEVLLHAEAKKLEELLATRALPGMNLNEEQEPAKPEKPLEPIAQRVTSQKSADLVKLPADQVRLAQKKVLLIDDAEINRVLMSHYLKGLPVKLDFAITSEMAFQKCQQSEFDLIVIDADLKAPDATEIAAELKSKGSLAKFAALSNAQGEDASPQLGFGITLRRGLARFQFTEQLKLLLWS